MDIVVITQEDNFVIPKNLEKLRNVKDVNLKSIITVEGGGALSNKKYYFFRGFGIFQSFKIAVKLSYIKVIDVLDRIIFDNKLIDNKLSINSLCKKYSIDLRHIRNINSKDSLNKIKIMNPDLIVSYSAPCIFSKELLDIPKLGAINLHCSMLPKYSGIMPSFWVLYNNESKTGVTVHYMDDKIDNGKIIEQASVKIEKNISIFQLINTTKDIGGDLVCKVVKNIRSENIKVSDNKYSKDNYNTWPTIRDIKLFRKRGGRLI